MMSSISASSPAAGVGLMLARVATVETEQVDLVHAAGRVLAEAITADRDSPAVDVSAMDGFALRAADVRLDSIAVSGEVRIGQQPPALAAGTALRIVTGAPVPPGADVVIRREDVEEREGRIFPCDAARGATFGLNIRRRGENARKSEMVIDRGAEITAPISGAIASCGCARPRVYRRLRIGVLITGDEVLDVSAQPEPWQLRDSNSWAIRNMISQRAWMEAVDKRTAIDDPATLKRAIASLIESCDCVIATGGVSMGDRDFVPLVARELGAEVVFHKVPQRPGKPIFGSVLPDGRPFFGLPGNPLSVMVTMRRMVVPVLERMAGSTSPPHPPLMRIESPDDRKLDLWWHRMVRTTNVGTAALVGVSSSGDVIAAATSDGFVEIPPGEGGAGPWPYYAWAF